MTSHVKNSGSFKCDAYGTNPICQGSYVSQKTERVIEGFESLPTWLFLDRELYQHLTFKGVLYELEAILKLDCRESRLISIDVSENSKWDSLVPGKQQLVTANFWAPLYPFCSAFKPVFESVAQKDRISKFVKIKVDQTPDIASKKHGTQGISVSKSFGERKEIGKAVGYIPKDNFKKDIEKIAVASTTSCLPNLSYAKSSASGVQFSC